MDSGLPQLLGNLRHRCDRGDLNTDMQTRIHCQFLHFVSLNSWSWFR